MPNTIADIFMAAALIVCIGIMAVVFSGVFMAIAVVGSTL
jgi:hypothetical protein